MGGSRWARSWLSLVLVWMFLLSCGAPPSNPDPDPDPTDSAAVFSIVSPAAGSPVSTATFFAIQVLDGTALQSVELYVGGAKVEPGFPGETPLRVFLVPGDHPVGPLALEARVRSAGVEYRRSIQVQVVRVPPSSATVGASGAVVGDVEANGAVSAVTIPAGVATGASVQFETLTQTEVLAQTGVDYDGLGVTFLGAQEIRSTIPTGDGVAMTSGGFGEMVQSGQTVVSYRIIPDAGRGTGELMVINGASVAPNGDVVSNPPVVPLAGDAVATSALGTFALSAHSGGPLRAAATLPGGPPGTFLEVPVSGLNIYAVDGYYVRFRVGSTTATAPATVSLNGNGRQVLFAVVPPMPAGAATVELVWKVGDTVFATYVMSITAPPPVPANPKAIVDANYAALIAAIDQADAAFQADGFALPFAPVRSEVVAIRAELTALAASDPRIVALARSLAGGGLATSTLDLGRIEALNSATCFLNARKFTTDNLFAKRAFRGDQRDIGLRGLTGNLNLSYLDRFADRLQDFPEYDCDPYEEFLCQELGNCGDDEVVEPWDDDVPNDPLPRPWRAPRSGGTPRDWMTGMGSAIWSGGPMGGSFRDDAPGASALTASAGGIAVSRVEPRRYVVRGIVNGGPLPFATEVAEDGYFFLPLLPAGQTTELVITDIDTGRECFQDVVGRAVGSAAVIYVDFAACAGDPGDPIEYTIRWVGPEAGSWNQASNWEPARVPDETDDVWIPGSLVEVTLPSGMPPVVTQVRSLRSQGTLTLTNSVLQATGAVDIGTYRVASAAADVQAADGFSYDGLRVSFSTDGGFTLPGDVTLKHVITEGTLVVPGTLTVTEALTFRNGGRISGAGTTAVPVGATATLNVGYLADGHTLEVHGDLTLPGGPFGDATSFVLLDGVRLRIMSGGVMRMSGFAFLGQATRAVLYNEGRVEIAADANVSVSMIQTENDGVWQVGAGGVVQITGSTGRFRNGAAGELTGPGTTAIAFQGVAEFVGGSITGGHRFVNRPGTFGGTTWLASPSAPLTIAAGSEIVNAPNPDNAQVSTFTVANARALSGGGTFRNQGVLRKEGGGTSDWTGVCYVVEGAGSLVEASGSIDFGSCPP